MIRMAYATTVKQHVSSIFDGIFMICALAQRRRSRGTYAEWLIGGTR